MAGTIPLAEPNKTAWLKAYYAICLKTFKIDGSDVSRGKSHAKTYKNKGISQLNQITFAVNNNDTVVILRPKQNFCLTAENLVTKAEIL